MALGLTAGQTFAVPVSAVTLTGFGISSSGAFTVGWDFTVTSSFFVTDLGIYDVGADGLNGSHDVGLWTAGGTLVATANVPSGSGGTLADSFRYAAITPLLLTPGTYIIGAANPGTGTYVGRATGFSVDPRLTFIGGRYVNGGSLAFPSLAEVVNNPEIFGAGMRIDAVPEPTTLALLGAGLVAHQPATAVMTGAASTVPAR